MQHAKAEKGQQLLVIHGPRKGKKRKYDLSIIIKKKDSTNKTMRLNAFFFFHW